MLSGSGEIALRRLEAALWARTKKFGERKEELMFEAVFFDLDGTLLPMDQDAFVEGYFGLLAGKMAPYGYEPHKLIQSVWAGTKAMVQNDGSCRNEEAFWRVFLGVYGETARAHIPVFEEFYAKEFQQAKSLCGFNPRAAETVRLAKSMGCRVILATNPLFPSVATESRIRWAGLSPEEFELYTTYENSSTCKPNPAYYREILTKCGLDARDCLMVGNDVGEDMIAETLGMQTFLLTDCLINRRNEDIDRWRHGGFAELQDCLRKCAAGA